MLLIPADQGPINSIQLQSLPTPKKTDQASFAREDEAQHLKQGTNKIPSTLRSRKGISNILLKGPTVYRSNIQCNQGVIEADSAPHIQMDHGFTTQVMQHGQVGNTSR
jgi:hypothetical protein